MQHSASSPATDRVPEPASVWEDFLDIFYAPSSVFARREHGSFWIPLLVVTLAIGILFFVNSGVMDPIMSAEMGRSKAMTDPRITPEMAEQARSISSVTGKIGAVIGLPITIVCIAFALWLAAKVVGARQTWHAALVVAAYSYVPKILDTLLMGVQGFLVAPDQLDGQFRLRLGPGRLLDPDTSAPLLVAIVGRVDLFTIWVTVLLAIGLAVTGRIDRGRAALAGVLVWVLGAIPFVGAALLA